MTEQVKKFPDEIPTDCPKRALRHILKSFSEHPALVGETYFQHLKFTTTMSIRLILVGIALFLHGLCPAFFCRTTSKQTKKIREILDHRETLGAE